MSKLMLTVLLLLNIFVSDVSATTDQDALLAIKSKITKAPEGVFKTWNDSIPFCQWHGVICGRRHQRVTVLNISGTSMVGSISPYIGNLSFLRYLFFDNNQLHGNIPPEIGNLFRLQVLSLVNNSLTGQLPANISSCSKLQIIGLSFNMLSGKIPNSLSSLQMIKILFLSKNKFTGGIPQFLGNLTSLEQLALSYNPLGGTIPDSLNKLKNLTKLGIGENQLVGTLRLFLFNLSMLDLLSVPENNLYGSLPSNLCSNQPHLQTLELGVNRLGGIIPRSISNCSELESLDLSQNNLTGDLDIAFDKLPYLILLLLGDNKFGNRSINGMNFLDSMSNCTNLEMFEVRNSNLGGMLPNSLGNLSSTLRYLGLDTNYISGSIPSSIGNLFGLTTLKLDSNNLIGSIPESIGQLENMENMRLDINYLSGTIPSSIGNMSLLSHVELYSNNLIGSIPASIGNCKSLTYLDFYANNLSGSVPKELLQLSSLSVKLDLSLNNFSGVLPNEIGNLKVLTYLDFSSNYFSGELPSSIGRCISLQTLNLSNNYFLGSLPEALNSLASLDFFDLSRNNLSGLIPTSLQQLPHVNLNLSYNNFAGEVPIKGSFANASAISLMGNDKLCGGIPELNLPKCTSTTNESKRSRKHRSTRIVLVISLSSIVGSLALVSFVLFCIKKRREKPSESLVIKSLERISYGRLFNATEGFSSENLIGKGSFASVYKGIFDEDGLIVAIKVLNLQRKGGFKSFTAECDALRHIRHRNLVKVLTSCSSVDYQNNDFKALVYDFMPNGNIDSWLHSTNGTLDLVQRINILKDVACALEYLHCQCENVVVHCDLKPSNILLDGDMVAHIGDFGLAKILSLEEVTNENDSSSSVIRGTIGYAPPEYGVGNEVSVSGDIYSYGIVLLEMLTRKKPVDPMFHEGLSLHSHARTALADGNVLQIIDSMLLHENVNENGLILLMDIGVQCSSQNPQDRMDIGTVVHKLLSVPVRS